MHSLSQAQLQDKTVSINDAICMPLFLFIQVTSKLLGTKGLVVPTVPGGDSKTPLITNEFKSHIEFAR
jgi:hypothetical protein